jgi:hypothetical protein
MKRTIRIGHERIQTLETRQRELQLWTDECQLVLETLRSQQRQEEEEEACQQEQKEEDGIEDKGKGTTFSLSSSVFHTTEPAADWILKEHRIYATVKE